MLLNLFYKLTLSNKCKCCNKKLKNSYLNFINNNYTLYCKKCNICYYFQNNKIHEIDFYNNIFYAFYYVEDNRVVVYLKNKNKKFILNKNFKIKIYYLLLIILKNILFFFKKKKKKTNKK